MRILRKLKSPGSVKSCLLLLVAISVLAAAVYLFVDRLASKEASETIPVKIELKERSPYYVVKPGDTLDGIATKQGTTWRALWEQNRDTIVDPNVIYPGQKLRGCTKDYCAPEPSLISPVEFNDRLWKFMFKQLSVIPLDEEHWKGALRNEIRWMGWQLEDKAFYRVRKNFDDFGIILLGLETHELAKSITAIYAKDPEMGYLVAALAWKETGFHNRRGKNGELGYYQFLPSTLESIYGGKEKSILAKIKVEDNPWFATRLAVWYLGNLKRTYKTWESTLYHYNGHPDYSGSVLYRASKIKEIMRNETGKK